MAVVKGIEGISVKGVGVEQEVLLEGVALAFFGEREVEEELMTDSVKKKSKTWSRDSKTRSKNSTQKRLKKQKKNRQKTKKTRQKTVKKLAQKFSIRSKTSLAI